MEKEGLVRAVDWLRENHLQMESIVTDRHVMIQKYLKENVEDCHHFFDVRHVSKGIYRTIDAIEMGEGHSLRTQYVNIAMRQRTVKCVESPQKPLICCVNFVERKAMMRGNVGF